MPSSLPPGADAATRRPVVIVSGASSGIGLACALELCRRGNTVVAGVRAADDLARLRDLRLPGLVPFVLDVTDGITIDAAVARAEVLAQGRGVAGLVNNAGVSTLGPVEWLTTESLRASFEVNVVGVVRLTARCLPALRQSRGRVVNIGSIAGLSALPFMGAYSASKHALEALTDALRVEVAPWGIEVAIVEAGAIDTPITGKALASLDAFPGTAAADGADYTVALRAFREAVVSTAAHGLPAARVVDAVVHALMARAPRTRYVVGSEAWGRWLLKRVLPDRWHDRAVRAIVGLPGAVSRSPASCRLPCSARR